MTAPPASGRGGKGRFDVTFDAAHLSAVERPAEFAQLLIDFWRSL